MLTGSGFGNNTFFAHFFCQQTLANGIVDFMRAGMIQIFALEKNLRTPHFSRQAFGKIQRAGASHILRHITVKFCLKLFVCFNIFISR